MHYTLAIRTTKNSLRLTDKGPDPKRRRLDEVIAAIKAQGLPRLGESPEPQLELDYDESDSEEPDTSEEPEVAQEDDQNLDKALESETEPSTDTELLPQTSKQTPEIELTTPGMWIRGQLVLAGYETDIKRRALHTNPPKLDKRQMALVPTRNPTRDGVLYAGERMQDGKIAKDMTLLHLEIDPDKLRMLLLSVPWETLVNTEASIVLNEKGQWTHVHIHATLAQLQHRAEMVPDYYLAIAQYGTATGWTGCEVTILTTITGKKQGKKSHLVSEVNALAEIQILGQKHFNKENQAARCMTQEFWISDKAIPRVVVKSLQENQPLFWIPCVRGGGRHIRPIINGIVSLRRMADLAPHQPGQTAATAEEIRAIFPRFDIPKVVKREGLTEHQLTTLDGFTDLTRLAFNPHAPANAPAHSSIEKREIHLEYKFWQAYHWIDTILTTKTEEEQSAIFEAIMALSHETAIAKLTLALTRTKKQRTKWSAQVRFIIADDYSYLTGHVTVQRDPKTSWSTRTPAKLTFDNPKLELAGTVTSITPRNNGKCQEIGVTMLSKATERYLRSHDMMRTSQVRVLASDQSWEDHDKEMWAMLSFAILNPRKCRADIEIMRVLLPNQLRLVNQIEAAVQDPYVYTYPTEFPEGVNDRQRAVIKALRTTEKCIAIRAPAGAGKTVTSQSGSEEHLKSGALRHQTEPLATKVLLVASDNGAVDRNENDIVRKICPKGWQHLRLQATSRTIEQAERSKDSRRAGDRFLSRDEQVPPRWFEEIKKSREQKEAETAQIDSAISNRYQIVTATISTALSRIRDSRFSMLIVEEASKVTKLELCQLLCLLNAEDQIQRRFIVVLLGDDRQLSRPTLSHVPAKRILETVFNESALERMNAILRPEDRHGLRQVYRASAEHANLVKNMIYLGQLEAPALPATRDSYMAAKPPGFPLPYRISQGKKIYVPAIYWVDVETQKAVTDSEREQTVRHCPETRKEFKTFMEKWHHAAGDAAFDELRVLAYYKDFERDFENDVTELKRRGITNLRGRVTTCDIAQGSQMPDIMLVPGWSANTRYKQLTHLTNMMRLCIALTRQQRSLTILADFEPMFKLSETTEKWRQLFSMIHQTGAFIMQPHRYQRACTLLRIDYDKRPPCIVAHTAAEFFRMRDKEVELRT